MAEGQELVLYILLRHDMASLKHTGKMIAQGAHAANQAAFEIGHNNFGGTAMRNFAEWEKSTGQGFGTTLVLGGIPDRYHPRGLRLVDITRIVEAVKRYGLPAGLTHDPSYPLQDGETLHGIPCDTCGWLFGTRDELWPYVRELILQPASPEF